ncbi:MAG: choice-of-anchor L domain-containing protein [Kofleriaceae bacterium]
MKSVILASLLLVACGPTARDDGPCNPGATRDCYDGQSGTENVGPCHGGTQMCLGTGEWSSCMNEVTPAAENCGDGIDNNCNGMVDEDIDSDGDGYTTCGGDCCDSTECSNPSEVNPGAFEVPGDGVDNDCDGMIDNAVPLCDSNISSATGNAADYAKAIDICQTTTMADKKWGLISATLTLTDGNGTPDASSRSVRTHFGTNVMPQMGGSMAVISSGTAAAEGDTNPSWSAPQGNGGFNLGYETSNEAAFPADFLAAHNGKLPNLMNCPDPDGSKANDPVMLTLTLRVPSNAHSFKLKTNFYSSEFPEFTCSAFNDFFVILLDSTFNGTPGNPADKNLAIYTDQSGNIYPVGVNLGYGNTGLFTQCKNGATGCSGKAGMINTCTGTDELAGTGFDDAKAGECSADSQVGGATGWLTTTGNVVPNEIIKIRIAIWDTSDHDYDSLALIDDFEWSVDGSDPGTVIE